ncbi:hypothetical protein [Limobrevibacterium gyesilva]|uniref:Uncharacterized protein n=1 Tax=Limobrevibacterium gyesilva TaxID=2991712 RepID=A0AA42CDC7_9PROT|nr:hypothetical protein [Limobrevibacterium gyesilva]MCW3474693.1 hypothetical protein [Limobrevibacterium gyesilva]
MTVRDQLLALQWTQLKHDEAYHKDVVILPLAQRIKHMALHNAKYTAHLFEVAETGDEARLIKTLTDAFIISLASANTLNQDLGGELGEAAVAATSLPALGADLTVELARSDADPLWLVRAFARQNGQLAKACESWDHLESVPFRDLMRSCNVAILKAVLVEASARELDLAEAYRARIREVETRSIFDGHYREGAGGEA